MKNNNYLAHHGILGQKWGVRRYQKKDGTLTKAGQRRYDYRKSKHYKTATKDARKKQREEYEANSRIVGRRRANVIEYKVREKHIKRDKAFWQEFGKSVAVSATMITLARMSPYLITSGMRWYDTQKARIKVNNAAVNAYATANNIPTSSKIGYGTGLKEANRGYKIAKKIIDQRNTK